MESLSPEKIAHIKDILKDIDVNSANQSLIQDNKIIFEKDNKFYRVRMPNQKEQILAEQEQNKTQVRLVQEDNTITRKKLIKVLKEKQDIDIEELEKKREEIKSQYQDTYLKLACILSDQPEKIEEARIEKNNIEDEFMTIHTEIEMALSPCIESQVKAQYYRYLAYLCTETQIDNEEFVPTWTSFEKFLSDGTGVDYKAIEHLQSLLLNIKE